MSLPKNDKIFCGLDENALTEMFKEPFGPIPALEEEVVLLDVNFDSDEELIKSVFPKKTYKIKYKRQVVDIEILWKSSSKEKQKKKIKNIVPMPDDRVLENYIRNYKN